MDCGYVDEMVCDGRIPEFRNIDESFKVQLLSIERMKMTNTAPNEPHDGIGIGTGTAVLIKRRGPFNPSAKNGRC
jgi:hypothetical protein